MIFYYTWYILINELVIDLFPNSLSRHPFQQNESKLKIGVRQQSLAIGVKTGSPRLRTCSSYDRHDFCYTHCFWLKRDVHYLNIGWDWVTRDCSDQVWADISHETIALDLSQAYRCQRSSTTSAVSGIERCSGKLCADTNFANFGLAVDRRPEPTLASVEFRITSVPELYSIGWLRYLSVFITMSLELRLEVCSDWTQWCKSSNGSFPLLCSLCSV